MAASVVHLSLTADTGTSAGSASSGSASAGSASAGSTSADISRSADMQGFGNNAAAGAKVGSSTSAQRVADAMIGANATVSAPNYAGLVAILKEDLATHSGKWTEPGFLAVAAHRLGRFAGSMQSGISRTLAIRAHHISADAIDWVWGIHLPLSVDLGRRVRIWHHGCILLNARAIGNDVHLRHNTTLGPVSGRFPAREGLPVIQDGADLGSGACVLGPVSVGRNATVGANTVVMKDVPEGVTVLGVPGRIVPS
jgi:serine O-acetyltransferase